MADSFDNKSIPADLKPAIVDLLYRLADDSLIVGHRNSEWTGIGPILEEDIAFSSMSQDKMGHALAFYNLLHELGERDPDTLAFLRNAPEFHCCSLVTLSPIPEDAPASDELSNNPTRDRLLAHGDWAISFVRQFLFVEADVVRNEALESSCYEPLAAVCRKIRGELRYHTMYSESTLRHLANGTDESRAKIVEAFETLWPHALGIFEPTEHDDALADRGACPLPICLMNDWRKRINPFLKEAGFTPPSKSNPIYGGRTGEHGPALEAALKDMQKVYRLEPTATW